MLPLKHSTLSKKLEEQFHVLEKSPQDLADSRIFFLGNTHYRKVQDLKISWLIQHLYQEGDLVLVETHENQLIAFCPETRFVTKPLKLSGWDSEIRQKESAQSNLLVRILAYIEQIRTTGFTENWVNDLHQLIRMFPPPNENHDQLIQDFCPQEKLETLTSPETRLHYFNEILEALATAWMEYLPYEVEVDLSVRNTSMVQKIEAALANHKRVFVIAGVDHLTLDRRFNNDQYKETIAAVNIVKEYCVGKSYAVLYPKESADENLSKIQKELKPTTWSKVHRAFKSFIKTATFRSVAHTIFIKPIVYLKHRVVALYQRVHNCFTKNNSSKQALKNRPKKSYTDWLHRLRLEELVALIKFHSQYSHLTKSQARDLLKQTHKQSTVEIDIHKRNALLIQEAQ